MNVLFVHNNFPGQFLHIARALASVLQARLVAIGSSTAQKLEASSYQRTAYETSTSPQYIHSLAASKSNVIAWSRSRIYYPVCQDRDLCQI